jgi:hypothetical protein
MLDPVPLEAQRHHLSPSQILTFGKSHCKVCCAHPSPRRVPTRVSWSDLVAWCVSLLDLSYLTQFFNSLQACLGTSSPASLGLSDQIFGSRVPYRIWEIEPGEMLGSHFSISKLVYSPHANSNHQNAKRYVLREPLLPFTDTYRFCRFLSHSIHSRSSTLSHRLHRRDQREWKC